MPFVNWTQLLFILVSGRFIFFSTLRALVLHFCCYSRDLGFFFFFNISFKEIQWLRLPPPPCLRFADRLTLHAQPVRAVLGLQDQAIAVLASILGGGGRALPPAPVSALGPTGGPLAPGGPPAVHCHKKQTHTATGQRQEELLEGRKGQGSSRNKAWTPKETHHQGVLHSFQLLEAAHALHASCGFCRLSFQEVWDYFFTDQAREV